MIQTEWASAEPIVRTAWLAPGDARWPALLRAMPHDVYHLPEYAAFGARHQATGEPRAFVAEADGARLLVPLIIRRLPPDVSGEGLFDATSPRGYPGPIAAVASDVDAGAFVRRAIGAFVDALNRRGIVTAFVRLHPLLGPPSEALVPAGAVVEHGESVSIDLALSTEELWAQTRHNHRRDINAARRSGYACRIDDAWGRLDAFADVYRQSMERLGADAFWHLPPAYFRQLHEALGPRLHLCVVERDGELAAGALLTETAGIVEYHLAGTADEHVAASPSKLIVDFARRWAKERGNACLHLAGSLRPGDSLNHFKLGFSPRRHPVRSWRVVADEAAYAQLVGESSVGPDADGADAFFPLYRRPAAVLA
jgi:hypothetical protein